MGVAGRGGGGYLGGRNTIVDSRHDLLRNKNWFDFQAVAQLADTGGDFVKHDWEKKTNSNKTMQQRGIESRREKKRKNMTGEEAKSNKSIK